MQKKQAIWILLGICLVVVILLAFLTVMLTGAMSSNPQGGETTLQGADATQGTTDTTQGTTDTTQETTEATLSSENALDLTQMQIVLPGEATAVEKSAADELVSYVEKMTQKTIPIVTEGTQVSAGIYIGETKFAQENEVTHPSTEFGEGWAIKAVNGNLVLCGDATRGTLYAVYHLLEDALGVRWWTYTEEYVPSCDGALVWNAYDDSGAPAFQYRDIHPGSRAWAANMFCQRNRLNGWNSTAKPQYGGLENYGAPAHIHTINRYITEEMIAEHPDWRAYLEPYTGEPWYAPNPDTLYCLTNQGLISALSELMLEAISKQYAEAEAAGNAPPRYYSMTLADGFGRCQCANCNVEAETRGWSGYVLNFVNQVAAPIAEKYPDVVVETMAYLDYLEPPIDDTKPADNVMVRLGDIFTDHTHSITHPNNEDYLRIMKAWAELCKDTEMHVWDYPRRGGNWGPVPNMFTFGEYIQTMYDLGIDGYFGELEDPITTDFWDLKVWVLAKLIEDPTLDQDALIDEFVYGYYGPGAVYVREYLDRMYDRAKDSNQNCNTLNPDWVRAEDILFAEECFQKAIRAADGDDDYTRRLHLARSALDKIIVENYDAYAQDAARNGLEFNIDKKHVCQRLVNCLSYQQGIVGLHDYENASILNRYQSILRDLENAELVG